MGLIATAGIIGSGKDEVGKIIQYLSWLDSMNGSSDLPDYELWKECVNPEDSGWKIRKYADKLKEIASLLLGVPREKFEDQEYKSSTLSKEWWEYEIEGPGGYFMSDAIVGIDKMTVREFLIRLGNGMREKVHSEIWINALFSDYKPLPGMQVAYDKMKTYPDWIITDVRYPNEVKAIEDRGGKIINVLRRDNPHPPINHHSETALDNHKFKFTIHNNGSLEELVEMTRVVYENTSH